MGNTAGRSPNRSRSDASRKARRNSGTAEAEYILQLVKSLVVEISDELSGRLERIVSARSRRRSKFVRAAILRALWEAEEQSTAEAYMRYPDNPDAAFEPAVWEGSGIPSER